MNRNALAFSIAIAIPLMASAADNHDHDHARDLDRVVITANPLKPTEAESAQAVVIVAGPDLRRKAAASLGQTLMDEVGVTSTAFGPGAGRPIIRGQDGARVRVMSNGIDSLDVSTVSVDHAATVEPFLADQIEILKGPSTLLYGSGAIGGVVNVVDGRIHERPLSEPFSGRAELRGDSNAGGGTAMARMDARIGELNLHVDGLRRDLGSVDASDSREIVNSGVETSTGAVGLSYANDSGFVGASLSRFETVYGIPQGVVGGDLEEESIAIDMAQTRLELKAGLQDPITALERVSANLAHNNYRHVEIADGELGTRFDNDATEMRVEAVHNPLGNWRGAFGVQIGQRDFQAIGDEAFVPPAKTKDLGFFLVESAKFGQFGLELGARAGRQSTDLSDGSADASHTLSSLAGSLSYALSESTKLSLALDQAERAPSAEELFSDGPHEATAAFEIGNAALKEERARQIELSLHHHADRFHGSLAIFRNNIADFIYQQSTGEIEDDLPVLQWAQVDAKFSGFEAEARMDLLESANGTWQARVFTDRVRAKDSNNENLPRIAPWRVGAGVQLDGPVWQAGVSATRTGKQDDVALGESATAGYNWLSANVAYRIEANDAAWEIFGRANNLSDAQANVHTSLLKDRAPLAGRSFELGLRVEF